MDLPLLERKEPTAPEQEDVKEDAKEVEAELKGDHEDEGPSDTKASKGTDTSKEMDETGRKACKIPPWNRFHSIYCCKYRYVAEGQSVVLFAPLHPRAMEILVRFHLLFAFFIIRR